jgi:hypothetical protein
MIDILASLEASALSVWLKESPTIWAYPTVLTLHTFGLAVLVGASAVLDLRLLGFAQAIPLAALAKSFRVMWIGFWINALTGAALFASVATTKGTTSVFLWKLAVIAVCVATMLLIERVVYERGAEGPTVTGAAKLLAVTSLALWAAAIALGRWMAYT